MLRSPQRALRPSTGAIAVLALLLLAPLAAQRAPDLSRKAFRTESELVTTAVTVRDTAGRLVTALGQSDFTVEEDGRPQPITQFTGDRVPVSLALVIDTSDSMRGARMDQARAAIQYFLDELLKPDDEIAIVSFNHTSQVVSGWTSDRARLRAGLDTLAAQGSTAMYDAVSKALPLFKGRTYTRAAMVVISDGADNASDLTPTQLKQILMTSDVFLYSIALDSADDRPSTRPNPFTLADISAQGGGYSEVIHAIDELGPATRRLADELSHQYLLGYTPNTPDNGQYRTVRVKVPSQRYAIRSRRGVVR